MHFLSLNWSLHHFSLKWLILTSHGKFLILEKIVPVKFIIPPTEPPLMKPLIARTLAPLLLARAAPAVIGPHHRGPQPPYIFLIQPPSHNRCHMRHRQTPLLTKSPLKNSQSSSKRALNSRREFQINEQLTFINFRPVSLCIILNSLRKSGGKSGKCIFYDYDLKIKTLFDIHFS